MMRRLAALLTILLLWTAPAWATIYYTAKTGSDSNTCVQAQSEATPKLTIEGGIGCLAASDTLNVKVGTYVEAIDDLIASGVSGSPTIIQTFGTDDVTIRPTTGGNGGDVVRFRGSRSYITLRGSAGHLLVLDAINVVNMALRASDSVHHIVVDYVEGKNAPTGNCFGIVGTGDTATHHVTLSHSKIHDCGVAGSTQYHGVYLRGADHLVEYNEIYNIPGGYGVHENSSVAESGARNIIRYNRVHDCLHRGILIGSGDDNIAHDNEVWDNGGFGIEVGFAGATNNQVYNNTIYSNSNTCISVRSTATGTILRNNICRSNTSDSISDSGVGTVASNNLFGTDPSFVNAAAFNFALADGSAAIGAGTTVPTRSCNGTCEVGAHETFGFSSAIVNENSLDLTLSMNLATPVLPATGLTGFTALVGAVPRTTLSASKLTGTDSVVRITFDGAVCTGGQTWTVTYAPGNATDSALIGNTANQPLSAFTAQAVTNGCGAAPPPDPGTPHIHYKLDDNTGTNANDETVNNLDGTLTNGPTWVTGKHGFAVHFADLGDDYIAVPYGSGIDPSTQSLTVCMGVLPDTGLESATRTFFGSSLGTNQRFFLSNISGTWSQGVQSSTAGVNSEFPVSAGWAFICRVSNSGTDTSTLYVNAVAGTSSESIKAYTSYTLTSNFTLGRGSGFGDSVSGGVTIDDPRVYLSAMTAANIQTLYDAWEPPPPPAIGTFTQVAHQFHNAVTVNGVVQNIGAPSGAISVRAGAAFALTTQTDCTVANCDPIGQQLHYSRNGGLFLAVPDNCANDSICFYGNGGDSTALTGAVTCCLTGALTPLTGSTQRTSGAVPNFDLPQNGSTVHRRVLKLGSNAVLSDTYDFKEYNQTGAAFTTYTPAGGARVTVGAALSAPTGLKLAGTTTNTTLTLIWPPNADTFLEGYKVYRSTTSGVYGQAFKTLTWTSAAAAHSPLTQLIIRELVADTYYYRVTAIDNGGNESAASSEISAVLAGMTPR